MILKGYVCVILAVVYHVKLKRGKYHSQTLRHLQKSELDYTRLYSVCMCYIYLYTDHVDLYVCLHGRTCVSVNMAGGRVWGTLMYLVIKALLIKGE